MSDYALMAQGVGAGGYIAVWKVVMFLVFFGGWAWVGQWMDKDAVAVHTNRTFWNNVYLAGGAAVLLLWFLLPAPFIVEVLLFVVVWATLAVSYVLHRNARVPATSRILTGDHIKYVFSSAGRQKEAQQRIVFISANKNELPVPSREDAEYEGYMSAEELVYDVWLRRVSRAELIPAGQEYQLRYVIDGVLGIAGQRDRHQTEQAMKYLKAVAGLEVKEKRLPQDGQFTIRTEQETVCELRLSTSGSTRGERMVLERYEEARTIRIDELGFHADQLKRIEEVINAPSGVVLVSGPARSGVTTTLYSIVRRHDAFIQNVHSLEVDPLTELDNITQNVVEGTGDGKAAARRLQSVLRGDPDVVLVGFCTSQEMAKVGTQAATDGKKLYFAMTAASTFHCLQDWMKMVGDGEKVANTLQAVTCQRLVRRLCPECRQAYAPDAGLLKKLNLPVDKIKRFFRPPTEVEYDKHGKPILCPQCQGTGYYGRTGVYETLFVTDAMREQIKENAPVNVLRVQCRKDKMLYLQEQALRKVIDGTTSIQEVLRVTADNPKKPAPAKKQADR